MVLHNDAPQQHDNGNGGGGSGGGGCDGNRTVEAGRYVPFPLLEEQGPCLILWGRAGQYAATMKKRKREEIAVLVEL